MTHWNIKCTVEKVDSRLDAVKGELTVIGLSGEAEGFLIELPSTQLRVVPRPGMELVALIVNGSVKTMILDGQDAYTNNSLPE
jgi:hypothetical protein